MNKKNIILIVGFLSLGCAMQTIQAAERFLAVSTGTLAIAWLGKVYLEDRRARKDFIKDVMGQLIFDAQDRLVYQDATLVSYVKNRAPSYGIDPEKIYCDFDIESPVMLTFSDTQGRSVIVYPASFQDQWAGKAESERESLKACLEKQLHDIAQGFAINHREHFLSPAGQEFRLAQPTLYASSLLMGVVANYLFHKISIPSVIAVPCSLAVAMYVKPQLDGLLEASRQSLSDAHLRDKETASLESFKQHALKIGNPGLLSAYATALPVDSEQHER